MTISAHGVFVTADDAAYLANALDELARLMAERRDANGHPTPSQPSPRLSMMTAKLHRTVDSLAVGGRAGDHRQRAQPPVWTGDGRAPQRNSVHAGPHDDIGTAEAARRLGITPNGVRDLARRGRLEVRRTRGRWLVDVASVEAHAARKAAYRGG